MTIVGAVKGATLAELIALQGGTPRRKPKAKAAPVKRKGKRISRADKAALLDTIVAHLKKNPDSGCGTIAKKFKLPSSRMGKYLKELRAKGRVGAVGEKVGMRYSVE